MPSSVLSIGSGDGIPGSTSAWQALCQPSPRPFMLILIRPGLILDLLVPVKISAGGGTQMRGGLSGFGSPGRSMPSWAYSHEPLQTLTSHRWRQTPGLPGRVWRFLEESLGRLPPEYHSCQWEPRPRGRAINGAVRMHGIRHEHSVHGRKFLGKKDPWVQSPQRRYMWQECWVHM